MVAEWSQLTTPYGENLPTTVFIVEATVEVPALKPKVVKGLAYVFK